MILCVGPTPAAQRVMVFARLSPDAVNRARLTLDTAAGKAVNVAKVLHGLGESPVVTGFVGGDRGTFIQDTLRALGVRADFVTVPERTRECVTVIDEAGGTVTELVEESRPVAPAAYEALWAKVLTHLPACAAVVLSGTLTPDAPEDFYARCVARARREGRLAVVDARGAPLLAALTARPGLVKPNRTELAATVGRELPDEAATLAAARALCDRGAERVVVTAGRDPLLAVEGGRAWRITPPAVRPRNPIGSGDAFTAALVAALVRAEELGAACRWGAAAGAANACTWLPGEVDPAQVHALATATVVERLA